MTSSFTCRQCGRGFTVAPAVLARYPGWTPPLCNECRQPGAGKRARFSGSPAVNGADHEAGVFTDGSCEGNPGPGGWGVVKVVNGSVADEAWGASPQTTNNRMELTALIEGMRRLSPAEEITVFTDSALCANTINLWAPAWQRQGWTRGARHERIANLDLVKELLELAQAHPGAKIEWIKGHAGNRWNEYADALSRAYQAKPV